MMGNNYNLPLQFEIDNQPFRIRNKGDFRTVFSCFNILYDNELSELEKTLVCLMVFYEDFDDVDAVLKCPYREELIKKMLWFFDCGQDYTQTKQQVKLIDWDADANLICSAINNVAGKEIRSEENLHWWTFVGYYMAIGDCALSNIVAIRSKIAKGEKLEKHEKKFKSENPQYFNIDYRTHDDKATDEWLEALWNGGAN